MRHADAQGVAGIGGRPANGRQPIKAILVGPPLAGAGIVALAVLAGYFWLAIKVVRRVLAA